MSRSAETPSAVKLRNCCTQAIAIINLCHRSAWHDLQGNDDLSSISQAADDLEEALRAAATLLEPVADHLCAEAAKEQEK